MFTLGVTYIGSNPIFLNFKIKFLFMNKYGEIGRHVRFRF